MFLDYFLIITFTVFVIAIAAIAIAAFAYLKQYKRMISAYESDSSEKDVYDFIYIEDKIINLSIVNKFELDRDKVIVYYDNDTTIINCASHEDAYDLFNQISMFIQPAITTI